MLYREATAEEQTQMTHMARMHYDLARTTDQVVPIFLLKDGRVDAQSNMSGIGYAMAIKDRLAPAEWLERRQKRVNDALLMGPGWLEPWGDTDAHSQPA